MSELLNLTNEELGEFYRGLLERIYKQRKTVPNHVPAACGLLVVNAHEQNASELAMRFKNFKFKNENLGHWEVTIKRVEEYVEPDLSEYIVDAQSIANGSYDALQSISMTMTDPLGDDPKVTHAAGIPKKDVK